MVDFRTVYTFWGNSGSDFLKWFYTLGELYLTSDVRALWRPAFVFIFFFTSGLCTAFSKNNFLRGCKLACVAAAVSIVTYYADVLFESDVYAMFGVLHCLAVVILLYSVTELIIKGITALFSLIAKRPYDKKAERIIQIVTCLTLGVVFCIIHDKFNVSINAHSNMIETDSKILGMFFYCENWWTADYFPLFPFIGFFFLGAGCTGLLYGKKRSLLPDVDGVWNRVFTFAGRHSLIFYLGGQIVVISFCAIASLIVMGRVI